MTDLRLILGGNDPSPEGDIELVGVFDTRKPGDSWYTTHMGMLKVWDFAEHCPEIIFFHYSVSLEI